MSEIVQNQYSSWQAENSGKWIYNGFIYVGQVDTDPEIPANQVRAFYIDENEQEVDLAQPIRTNSSGFPVISETNSTVIQIRTDGDHSVKVLNKKGSQEWYTPKASSLSPVIVINHNDTLNRNAISAHDEIYIRELTSTQILTNDELGSAPIGTRYVSTDLDRARYNVVADSDVDGFYFGSAINGKKLRFIPVGISTPEMFGADGVDDTAAIDGASSINEPLDLKNKTYIYNAASHSGAAVVLPSSITGEGWTIRCLGAVELRFRDNSSFVGGTFSSDNVFTIDPAVPRSSAASGVMLLTNSESITKLKFHCDCSYDAESDGSMRGEGFLRITSFDDADIDINSTQRGAVLSTWINPQGGLIQGRLRFENFETGLLKRSGLSEELNIDGINTPAQILNFRNTSDTVPSVNGKDTILSEASGVQTQTTNLTLNSEYNIERGAYLQQCGSGTIYSTSVGCDGGRSTDGVSNLVVYATTTLTVDGSTEQRYAWQVTGGSNGPANNIDVHPTLINNTGASGNKECVSLFGECNDIRIHEPYGYECGNGLLLIQDPGSIFTPMIDGLTVIGGRAEGVNGQTPSNGALSIAFGTLSQTAYVRNVTVDGTASMPSSSGSGTFNFRNIETSTRILNVKIDGVTTAADYEAHVPVINCQNVTQDSIELTSIANGYEYIYPLAILRTNLAINSTSVIDLGNIPTPPNPAAINVELRASHNSQPSQNYIRYNVDMILGSSGATTQMITNQSDLAASQTLTLAYSHATGDINLTHTSSSSLGFDDETFYAVVRSTKEITF